MNFTNVLVGIILTILGWLTVEVFSLVQSNEHRITVLETKLEE